MPLASFVPCERFECGGNRGKHDQSLEVIAVNRPYLPGEDLKFATLAAGLVFIS